ncbi:MAG: tripartite tricarboxylate transporter substrate-binding protein, partial [Burkholderiales bacterium]
SAQPLLASGKVRALAVTSTERVAVAPGLPTVQEAAKLASYEVNGWYGVCAAAGTPPALVERLNRDINRVLAMPEVRERMTAAGTLPAGGTPAQLAQLVRSEVEKWSRIIRQAALSPGAS